MEVVRGMSRSSSECSPGLVEVLMIVVISVPPEVSLTQEVSGRRTRERARSCAVCGLVVSRTSHCACPARCASTTPTTRSATSARSR